MNTRERRILLGVCVGCENPNLETERRCADCNLAQRLYQASLRAERKQRGRCHKCGKPKRADRSYCYECAAYNAEYWHKRKERKQDAKEK